MNGSRNSANFFDNKPLDGCNVRDDNVLVISFIIVDCGTFS